MKSLLVLVGPTASGKTALAEALARDRPLCLLSADSQQVYRGLDIGTAKPGPETRAAWSLLDLAELGETFSAGAFCRLALETCEAAWASGRTPLLCGGTGLYLKALLDGLVELPPTPPDIREALERTWKEQGLEPLLRRLDAVDPVLAASLDRANPRRVLRALEVHAATGRPLSAWQAESTRPALSPERVLWLGLDPGQEALTQRMAQRMEACLAEGWLEEVRSLAQRHGDAALQACAAIGYPELLDHLRGRLSLAQAKELLLARTRRYARRQRTWFRGLDSVLWASEAEPLAAEARKFLDAGA